jgi:hypothetical protein
MRIRLLSLCLAAALLPVSASAQQERLTQPASIPYELALALTGSGGLGSDAEPQILVGGIPEWALNRVSLPTGWRPLGSAFLGTTVVGVVEIPTANDSLIKRFQQHLERNGWKPAPPPNQGYMGGGFRSPPTQAATTRAARRFQLCRDSQILTAWIARELPLATTIAFRLANVTPGQFSVCNPPAPDPRTLQAMRERGEPTLYDPSPRDFGPSGCREEDNGWQGSETRYRTPMSADQILDHYGKQLADSGWLATPPRQTPVARTWTRTDSGGFLRRMTLTVSRGIIDTGCVRVHMENRNPPPAR